MHLGRSGECETAAVSDWSNSQCRGRNSWPWSWGHLHTRSCRLHQYGSQKPDQPLPVSTQVFHNFHLQIFLVLIPGCFRANIEVKEWGRHGINASNQKQKVGILKQKYFEVWSKIKLDVRDACVASDNNSHASWNVMFRSFSACSIISW